MDGALVMTVVHKVLYPGGYSRRGSAVPLILKVNRSFPAGWYRRQRLTGLNVSRALRHCLAPAGIERYCRG